MTVNGGTLSAGGNLILSSSKGTLTIKGGTVKVASDKEIQLNSTQDYGSSIYLDGGVLETPSIRRTAKWTTIYFNGGTLKANGTSGTDISKVTCPLAPDTVFAIGGEDNKSIVVENAGTPLDVNYWTGAAMTLGAGTTLWLNTATLCNTLNLPTGENEVATIRIDGTKLSGGDHTIATVGAGATANVSLDPASTALDGRKGSLRVEGGNLVLNVKSKGTMLIIR